MPQLLLGLTGGGTDMSPVTIAAAAGAAIEALNQPKELVTPDGWVRP
jgi:hypothetical protein